MKTMTVLLSVCAVGAMTASAVPKLAPPFADGAVLQCGTKVPVWGTADPGERVTVSFAGQRVSARADASGRWRVALEPMVASKTGRELRVSTEAAADDLVVSDVLVGEVWFASGQSNMAFSLCVGKPQACGDVHGRMVAQMTRLPWVRYAAVRGQVSFEPRKTAELKWERFEPGFLTRPWAISAVAFYFARELAIALDVPIGVICACSGATCIETWTPKCGFAAHPELKDLDGWKYFAEKDWPKEWTTCPFNDWRQQPSLFWNGQVEAIVPYALRGLIWYQGCHNTTRPENYSVKLHALYDGWSEKFENRRLKMYVVQLPAWGRSDAHQVLIQEAQARFADEEPNAGLAVINDVGNVRDIHPDDKEPVGRRLALQALAKDYGFTDIECESPVLQDWKVVGNRFVLAFRHAKSLYVLNRDRSLSAPFEISGEDGVFRPAKIVNFLTRKVDGKSKPTGALADNVLELVADGVDKPVNLRYLHCAPWIGSVFNEVNLPLGTFHIGLCGIRPSRVK